MAGQSLIDFLKKLYIVTDLSEAIFLLASRLYDLIQNTFKIGVILFRDQIIILGIHSFNDFDYAFNIGLIVENRLVAFVFLILKHVASYQLIEAISEDILR